MCACDLYVVVVPAEGEPTCLYQWFKDNEEIEGATADVLTIRANDASCVGQYTCTVTNMVGSVSTTVAEVRFVNRNTVRGCC